MSLELLTKSIEEHSRAVESLKGSFEKDISEVKTHLSELEQEFARIPAGGIRTSQQKGSDIANRFIESDQFQALTKGAPSTGRVAMSDIAIKSITNSGAGIARSTDYDIAPQRAQGLYNAPLQPLSLLAALPSLPVSSGVFEYLQLGAYTNAAAFQTEEGQLKAEAAMPTELEQAQVATIAHWIKAGQQVLDDAPALSQQIGNLLQYGLMAKLEASIVGGAGGKGEIKGLLSHAVAHTPTGTPKAADAIGQAALSLQAAGWNAGLIILNPTDWFSVASERDAAGQYILGSPRDPSPAGLWGIQVVLTPSLPTGTALVMDPKQVAVLDRMQPTLVASRDDDKNLTSNLVTILAEMRAGLAVFAKGAVLSVAI